MQLHSVGGVGSAEIAVVGAKRMGEGAGEGREKLAQGFIDSSAWPRNRAARCF